MPRVNAWWASLVGASPEWVERYAKNLPFDAMGEGVIRALEEAARCWRTSRWTIVLDGPDDVFYARFLEHCTHKPSWKRVSVTQREKRMVGRTHSSHGMPNTLWVYTRKPMEKFHKSVMARRSSGSRGEPWPQSSFLSHVYFTRGPREAEDFCDTMLSTIFLGQELKEFPLVMNRVWSLLSTVMLRKGMSILSCTIHWFIDSEASRKQFLSFNLRESSSKRKRSVIPQSSIDAKVPIDAMALVDGKEETIMGLLSIRESAYQEIPTVQPSMNSPISTLFLVRTWMTTLLSQHLSPGVFLHNTFSALVVQFYHSNMTVDGVLEDDILGSIMHRYFSSPIPSDEEHPLRAIMEANPSLMESVAMSHLSSVVCADTLQWPPYTDEDELRAVSTIRWAFTAMTNPQAYEEARDQAMEYYGPDVFTFVQKIPAPHLVVSLYGCSMAHLIFLLDVIQLVLRQAFQGYRIVYTSRDFLSTLTREDANDDQYESGERQRQTQGNYDSLDHHDAVGNHGGSCSDSGSDDWEDDLIVAKVEDSDPFLFYFQVLPKSDHASCLTVGIGESDPSSIVEYFGQEMGHTSDEEVEEALLGVEFPFPDETTGTPQSAEGILNSLSMRMTHMLRISTLWVQTFSTHRHVQRSHSTLGVTCPLYPILGQVLDMCYRDARKIGNPDHPLMFVVRSEATLAFKMLSKHFSGIEVKRPDTEAGMLFLYAVPVLVNRPEDIGRFVRAIDVSPLVQEIYKEEDGALWKHVPSTQMIDGTRSCPQTMSLLDELNIESIEIVQMGPQSFLGREPRTQNPLVIAGEDPCIAGEPSGPSRFFFDPRLWSKFVNYLTQVLWFDDRSRFQDIVAELLDHMMPFDEFEAQRILHKQDKEVSTGGKGKPKRDDTMLHSAIEKHRLKGAEHASSAVSNPFVTVARYMEERSSRGYADILSMPQGGPYNFHLPIDAVRTSFLDRRPEMEFAFFDQCIGVPGTLPGKGWQMFKEHCGSSFIPDVLYLFGRSKSEQTYFMG